MEIVNCMYSVRLVITHSGVDTILSAMECVRQYLYRNIFNVK